MSELLADDVVLDAGGWDRRYARVLAVAMVGTDRAVVMVDSNGAQGDQPYENIESLTCLDGTWRCEGSGNCGSKGSGWRAGVIYAYGRAPDCVSVVVEHAGEHRDVLVQRDGWWLFATDDPTGRAQNRPRRVL